MVALTIETDGRGRDARPSSSGIGLAIGPGEAAYLPLGHVAGSDGLFGEPVAGQVPLGEALAAARGRRSRTRR